MSVNMIATASSPPLTASAANAAIATAIAHGGAKRRSNSAAHMASRPTNATEPWPWAEPSKRE
jgi:hypothetical protein